jgi:SAM-dependent MidA family methyltransferase
MKQAAADAGLETIALLDQTYFLLGLLTGAPNTENPENLENLGNLGNLRTLLMPGGLGSTMKVLILGKGVGTPPLRGTSYRVRVT